MNRAIIATHQLADCRDVVQVGVGQEYGLGYCSPGIENARDSVRLVTGVDDKRPAGLARMAYDVAVRLKGANGQSMNLQPAGIGGVQTENEVPQPQDPVAFGLSNVNPDPLKLL